MIAGKPKDLPALFCAEEAFIAAGAIGRPGPRDDRHGAARGKPLAIVVNPQRNCMSVKPSRRDGVVLASGIVAEMRPRHIDDVGEASRRYDRAISNVHHGWHVCWRLLVLKRSDGAAATAANEPNVRSSTVRRRGVPDVLAVDERRQERLSAGSTEWRRHGWECKGDEAELSVPPTTTECV